MGASATSPLAPGSSAQSVGAMLVFTDLDGTLLDHDHYGWEPARGALERLRAGGHPVVLTSSKTLAELEVLQWELDLEGPVIAENGALLAVPQALVSSDGLESLGPWRLYRCSPTYEVIVRTLARLRTEHGYPFVGFADLTAGEISDLTGLRLEDAEAARRREGSEPLQWQGEPSRLVEFDKDLAQLSLRRLTGGRFHHVLGAAADKAAAMSALRRLLADNGQSYGATVALGDGPNDRAMLAAADYPILVANPKAPIFDTSGISGLIRTRGQGPVGWAEAITRLLDR